MSIANSSTIKIELQVDDKGKIKMKQFGLEAEDAGKKGSKSFKGMGKDAEGFNKKAGLSLSTVLKLGGAYIGLQKLQQAYGWLKAEVVEYVGLANIQEKAETKLAATLRATGGAAGYNLDQLRAMASGMQDVTAVGDEVILSNMGILATFKNVRKEGFERATMAALDMSAVMEQDLKSSMVQLGKALNDPIKGVSALSDVGVTFTAQQKEQIRVLQESGKMYEAQTIILKELESEFGGAAAAAKETFAGGMKGATGSLSDMQEELGFVITKNTFFIELTHKAEELFKSWGASIKDNRVWLMELAKSGVLFLVDALGVAIQGVGFLHKAWLGLKVIGAAVVEGLITGLDYLAEAVRMVLKPWDLLFEGLVKLGAIETNPFDRLTESTHSLREAVTGMTVGIIEDVHTVDAQYKSWVQTIELAGDNIAAIKAENRDAADTIVAGNKEIKESFEDAATGAQGLLKVEEDLTAKIKKLTLDSLEYKKWALDQELAAMRAKAKGSQTALAKIGEYEKIARAKLGEERLKQAQEIDGRYLEEKRRTLDKEYALLKTQVSDRHALEVWYAQEKAELDKESLEHRKDTAESFFDYYQAKLAEEKGTWKDADTLRLESYDRTYESMKGVTKEFSGVFQKELSGQILGKFKGAALDMESLWASAWDSMLSKAVKTVSDIAGEAVVGKLAQIGRDLMGYGGFTSYLGGVGDFVSNILPFHQGGWDILPDEQPALLKKGEMVIPPHIAEQIRRDVGGKDWGGVADAIGKATVSPELAGVLGSSLSQAGYTAATMAAAASRAGAPSGVVRDVMAGYGLAQFGYSATKGILGEAFGTSAPIGEVNVPGLGRVSISPQDLADISAAVVGAIAGGPMGAVVGLLGGVAISALADALDARQFEPFHDMLEDKYGWITVNRSLARMGSLADVAAELHQADVNKMYGINQAVSEIQQGYDYGFMAAKASKRYGIPEMMAQIQQPGRPSSRGGIGRTGGGQDAAGSGLGLGGDNNEGYGGGEGGARGYRHGGRAKKDGKYVWQEWGLPGEAFIPETNGYVMSHEDTQELLKNLQAITSGGMTRPSESASPVTVAPQVSVTVRVGTREIRDLVVEDIRFRSEHGEGIVHSGGVYQERRS